MDREIYVEIPWFTKYQVSNMWNVRSKDYPYTVVVNWKTKNYFHKWRTLKVDICKKRGYKYVRIGSSQTWKRVWVHRLVCAWFLGLNLDNGKQFACHKNDIANDNRVENLYVGDSKSNVRDMRERWRCTIDNSWSRNWMSRLSEDDVINIRQMRKEWIKRRTLSWIFWVHPDYISKLTWNAKTKYWKCI
jgi:hypothetical protein